MCRLNNKHLQWLEPCLYKKDFEEKQSKLESDKDIKFNKNDAEGKKIIKQKENKELEKKNFIESTSMNQIKFSKALNDIQYERLELINQKVNAEKDIRNNQSMIEKYRKDISDLQKQKSEPMIDIEPFKLKDKEYDIQKEETENLYNNILEMINILSDKGIKSYIIKKYIPILNEYVNKYLEIFSAKYRIAFDENFDIEIFARGYEKLSYGSFSSGEEQRLDLSLLFAFYELGKMKKSINSNVIFLDEISDKSLDSDGIDGLMNIFNSLKRSGKTVYNISHRVEMQDRFDRTLKVNKKMFSKIETV